MSSIFQKFRHLIAVEKSADVHQQVNSGGRDWENFYRSRWSLYSLHRIKYPYMRGELAELWREARKNHPTALAAW